MTVELTFLGHATFQVKTSNSVILVDPFLTGNPVASAPAASLEADAILITHGHGDHVGDVVDIAKRTGATVVANYEICEWLQGQGVENVHAQHIGGAHEHKFGQVKLTIAHHGSMLPDGSDGGSPCGVLLTVDDCTIYFAGDTGLFLDMQLIGAAGIDLAVLPIGDNFTMGPDDALKAVEFLKPKRVVPCHFDTFPLIAQDAEAFAEGVRNGGIAEPVVLSRGSPFHSDAFQARAHLQSSDLRNGRLIKTQQEVLHLFPADSCVGWQPEA